MPIHLGSKSAITGYKRPASSLCLWIILAVLTRWLLLSTVSVSLSVEETSALLQKVPAAYRTEINDVLLTALVQTFTQWTRTPTGGSGGHGREARKRYRFIANGWLVYNYLPSGANFGGIFPAREAIEGH